MEPYEGKQAHVLRRYNQRDNCKRIVAYITVGAQVTVDSIIGNEPLDVPAWAEKSYCHSEAGRCFPGTSGYAALPMSH